MTITFQNLLSNLSLNNPSFILMTIIISSVILLNGWTVAPNAIATCVSTRCLSPKRAILMVAIFNFLGVFFMSFISSKVAETVFHIVNFGDDAVICQTALCTALVAIVTWALLAWKLEIPTSQSHALIAGLSGAAIAIRGGISGINLNEWSKVIYGLLISTGFGFGSGFITVKLIEKICKDIDKRKTKKFFKVSQIVGGALMAFMHGAQDGQKFIGVFLLGVAFANGITNIESFTIPIWLMIVCSLLMTLGLCLGGDKIIKTVGMKMAKLETYQGAAVDIASAGCLLAASLLGIPVSTAHTKSTAVIGVGVAKRLSCVNWNVVKNMVLAWIFTFPGCGILGYLMTLVVMKIFN